ncbi:hypothetical protein KM043_006043 [Ampulex compressa]|nr:hypothetical protein KM043_006043 [Ampulex compressa]
MKDSLWGPFHVVTFNSVILLLMISHLKAVCSDPGVVPLPQNRMDFSDIHIAGYEIGDKCDEKDNWTVCTRCETYRPPKAQHCRICKRCVRRMDHHCPWINNCVGERNQKYFIQFLVYVGMLALYAITLVIASWFFECPQCNNDINFALCYIGTGIFTLWDVCHCNFNRSISSYLGGRSNWRTCSKWTLSYQQKKIAHIYIVVPSLWKKSSSIMAPSLSKAILLFFQKGNIFN